MLKVTDFSLQLPANFLFSCGLYCVVNKTRIWKYSFGLGFSEF